MSGPRIVALVLAAIAVAILAASVSWPGGSQGVPGPALVPRVLGVGLLLVALLIVRTPGHGAPAPVRNQVAVPVTMGLLAVYAVLWHVVPYGVLTAGVLIAYLRTAGLSWRGALVAAVVMATALAVLFERGLGVRF